MNVSDSLRKATHSIQSNVHFQILELIWVSHNHDSLQKYI